MFPQSIILFNVKQTGEMVNAPRNTIACETRSPIMLLLSFCPHGRTHSNSLTVYVAVDAPRAPAGTPVRKPLLKRRGTFLRCRMRPVPVVFLRLAFSPQLTVILSIDCKSVIVVSIDVHLRVLAAGYPHEEHVCFWMWRERRPALLSAHCFRPWPCSSPSFKIGSTTGSRRHRNDVPQRLQSVCVLLWRFPKLEVPFARSQ
jgi:hypothetical protein